MKKTLLLTIVIGMMALFTANAQKERDVFNIKVDGLGCPFCAYGLEKKFKEFKGIKQIKIDIDTGLFTFTYPSDKELSMEKVEKQVQAAGYTPVFTRIERGNGDIEETVEKTESQ